MPYIGYSSPVFPLLVAAGILYVLYRAVNGFFAENGTEQAAILYHVLLTVGIAFAVIKYFVHLNFLGVILAILATYIVGTWIGGWLFPTSKEFGDGRQNDKSAEQDHEQINR